MRSKNALKNISISIFSQIIIILLGFLSRKVFVDSLGAEYLGINGLLTNVLSMMVLIEGGIGASIVYNLYKPLANNDKDKIIALVNLYKKSYGILSIIMIAISVILYPFIGIIMKLDKPIHGMVVVYFIFITKNVISYINAYKWALINADQKGYVLATTNLIFQIITTIGKILIIVITHNYIFFLIVEVVIFIIQNVINTNIVYKKYPYLRKKSKYNIDTETKKNINKNVKAMFLHNIGGYLVFSTDNILISTFISVKAVGLYSNYTMIIDQLSSLLLPIVNGIGASVGNLIATEDENKTYSIFKVSFLISFWIYSFSTIALFILLEDFIVWWIGENYLLSSSILIVVLINFYLNGMQNAIGTFKNKAGLFVQDRYIMMFNGFLNLIASLVFIKHFGFIGVFLGTTISTLTTVFWTQPMVVYKYLFKKSVKDYFLKYIFLSGLTILLGILIRNLCNTLISGNGIISIISKGIICTLVINTIYIIIFYRTEEFKYLLKNIKVQITSSSIFKKILRVN